MCYALNLRSSQKDTEIRVACSRTPPLFPDFSLFYLAGGFAASLTHILLYPTSTIPTVGASGAIAATLGAYLLLFPNRRVLTIIPFGFFMQVARIPALFVLGMWFLLQLLEGTLALDMAQLGGVAFWAHIGGFVFGMLFGPLLRLRKRLPMNMVGDRGRW